MAVATSRMLCQISRCPSRERLRTGHGVKCSELPRDCTVSDPKSAILDDIPAKKPRDKHLLLLFLNVYRVVWTHTCCLLLYNEYHIISYNIIYIYIYLITVHYIDNV